MTRNDATPLATLVAHRLSRRQALLGGTVLTGLGLYGARLVGSAQASGSSLTFQELPRHFDDTDHVAPGYQRQVLIRWGDPVIPGAPAFDPAAQSVASQSLQFGYNNDFIGYLPLPFGSANSSHGLLVVNHEYPNPHVMFDGLNAGEEATATSAEQAAIEAACQGLSIVEIEKANGAWRVVAGSAHNRRITTDTAILIAGPVAGHDLLKTSEDPTGTLVQGTQDNCSGGVTPWGTVLSCEEGSADWFGGDPSKVAGAAILERSGWTAEDIGFYGWAAHMARFNVDVEPNEPFRFEWVVEVDPYTPGSMPVKRTALGRFGHEAATSVVNGDGHVVVYMGDDDYFEYAYKFVSSGTYDPTDRAANFGLLDDGILYVARFNDDGSLDWLPLVQGMGPLTAANGFATQADVLLNPRGAGDLLGATPMDRPEDFEASPTTGRVYLVLTKNKKREAGDENAANSRAGNLVGQILELIPPQVNGQADHTAERYTWDAFILAGDPTSADQGAIYGDGVTTDGWFACPDNIAFDPQGRLWVATDGAPAFEIADGLYGVETDGDGRAVPRSLYAVPADAELCGPCFTPDGLTLFLSVQHPGEDSDNMASLTTRWPDFDAAMPPRPSVVVITREGGGTIGS